MKKVFLRFWPILFITSLWFLFSYPYFLEQKVPFPSKYQVTFFTPWSHNQEWWGPVKNNAMPDVISQIYPWKYFTIASLKNGDIPFWNPYNFAGNPHVGNFQTAVFSPFNILFFVLPFIDAWSLIVLLQPLLAGCFTYMLLRTLSASKISSLIGAVAFMFCGFIVVWMAYGTLAMAIAFLPLALWAIEKTFLTKHKRYLWLFFLSIVASYFSGHFQISLYFSFFVSAFILFKILTANEYKIGLLVLLTFIVGICVSGIQLLPTISLYADSVRSGLVYSGGGIPWNYIITIIAPDFYGNPVTRNDWYGTYAEWSGFIGVIPILLTGFVIFNVKNKYHLFFSIMAVVTLVLSMDTPVHKLLTASGIPIIATSIPSRMVVLFSFAISILSAFGFDQIVDLKRSKHTKRILPVVIALSTVVVLALVLPRVTDFVPIEKRLIGVKNIILPISLFVACITLIIYFRRVSTKKTALFIGCMILLLTTFDSYRFASKWMPFDDRSLVYPEMPVIQGIRERIGHGRIFGNVGTQVETYYGFGSLEGYDPLYIQRYGEFIQTSRTGEFANAERSVVRLDRKGKYTERVLDLLGVNIIFHPIADTNQEWAFPVWEDYDRYSVIYQDSSFQLFRNNKALPRAALFYNFEVIDNPKSLLKRFYTDDFDFRSILLLEEKPDLAKNQPEAVKGKAIIKKYSANKIIIDVNTEEAALLFLSDTYYNKWKVRVNGNDGKILIADYAFRAVEVPRGKSRVEFYYDEYGIIP